MNKTVKVSVIIPVFNPGEGINKCLKCLQKQSLRDIELIFIDDCGADRIHILRIRKAAEVDPRIVLLQNSCNIGAGRTRNKGIEYARGEYLAFVDPDDYISEDFLELLYNKAIDNDSDIVKGVLVYVDGHGKTTRASRMNSEIQNGLSEGRPLYSLFNSEHTSAIYSHKIFDLYNTRYGLSSYAEDRVFLFRVCNSVKSIAIENKALYYYVSRQGSSVGKITIERFNGELLSCREIIDYMESHSLYTQGACEYLSQLIVNVMVIAKIIGNQSLGIETDKMLDEVKQLLKELPCAGMVVEKNIVLRALKEYDLNLAVIPYNKRWYKTSYSVYREQVINWVEFLRKHPEEIRCCYPYIWQVFEYAISFDDWAKEKKFKRKEALKELRMQAYRLPDRSVLTKKFLSMKMFMDYRVNTFVIRQTVIGHVIQKAKLTIRSLKNRRK